MTVKTVLLQYANCCKVTDVAVLLSGGIDSASVMFSLLEAGKKVTAYSFMLDGKMSTDFLLAKKNARQFGVEFMPVILPSSIQTLKTNLIELVHLGAKSKTDFECSWPMLHTYAVIRESHVFSGMGADGHFCISKKGMLHFRNKIDVFRKITFGNPRYAQQPIHSALAKKYGKTSVLPYVSKEMQSVFFGKTWDQVNKPHQKQPILDAFPEQYKKIKILPHTNLQLGDSGIAKHFEKLLATDWNKGNWKSVVGIYNALGKGAIK